MSLGDFGGPPLFLPFLGRSNGRGRPKGKEP